MVKVIMLVFCLLMTSCVNEKARNKHRANWWKAVRKLCKDSCPNNTFSYRIEQFIGKFGHFYKCFCYPQFGAPKISRFDHRVVREKVRRMNSIPFK